MPFFVGNLYFAYSELAEVWFEERNKGEKETAVLKYMLRKIGDGETLSEEMIVLKRKITNFCRYLSQKWQNSHRKRVVFETKNSEWLNAQFKIEIKKFSIEPSTSAVGRPKKNFGEKSERSKRRDADELSKSVQHETELCVRAATKSARKQNQLDLAVVLKETLASPTRPSKLRKISESATKKPVRYTTEEALSFILENNFTKAQYLNIRSENKSRNCDIYPLYNDVALSKLKCRPDGIEVTEKCAKVSLQMLLTHTANRIVEMQREVVAAAMAKNVVVLKADLIVSYGFDGSTGQSLYKQRFDEAGTSGDFDLSLFATTLIPLRLIDSFGKPLWNNRTPQSIRFCRPIKLQYIKETREIILEEDLDLKRQIAELKNIRIQVDETRIIEICFKLSLTLIDGKVLNVLTNTKSSQTCPICGANPKDFMKITNFESETFHAKEGNLKYGLSPLHCWIRVFEFILHAGYKCEIKKWQIRKEEERKVVLEKKRKIQKLFWEKMSLHVDKPKTGGFGSTNDGNTARRAFADHALFSHITGIDEELIYSLKIILICICCQFPLDLEKFKTFCFNTAKIIQTKYSWLPMTPTVHKLLIHSKEIVENTILPIGCFGEDAAEAHHRIYKSDRLLHSRKSSRKNNMSDIFNRAMDMSDPLVSSINLKTRMDTRKRLQLPREVIDMLCSPEVHPCSFESIEDLSASEDDECEDDVNTITDFMYTNVLDDINLQNDFNITIE